jgi:hypothetical protein
MNKHGYTGVRKRCSPQHWRKPYYARISAGCEKFIYSKNFATAEQAAKEYQRMKSGREALRRTT